MTLVMKFGGTSVGSAAAMERTATLIRQSIAAGRQVVVVCSGMGSRPVKVTDLLLQGAHAALAGDQETYQNVARQLRDIHFTVIDALLSGEVSHPAVRAEIERFISRFEDLCAAVMVLGELTPRALDTISAMGEQMGARIVAAYLQAIGQPAEAIDATEIVVTDNNYQNASPLWSETTLSTRKRLLPLLDAGIVPVVTGFVGATQAGITTTLGRGGSDFSAAIMGQALGAEEVWIWTDVDGVMSADPRLVPEARNIPELSFREVAELAFYGARVLHPKTIRPCVEVGIPLRIKNTFNPDHAGTVIVQRSTANNGGMKAVTAITDLSLITVEGRGMMGVPGIAARTFGTAAANDVSVLLITQASSEQSICFAAPEETTEQVIAGLEKEFERELDRQDIDRVWAIRPVAIITVVGAGMRGTPGIAGRLFTALGNQQINIIAIAQGSSECSISLVVAGRDTAEAVRHIHTLL
jgi:aspartate kinase